MDYHGASLVRCRSHSVCYTYHAKMLAFLPTNFHRVLILGVLHLAVAFSARAQGGPPLLTNDPGTPGNGNWEINIGVMPVLRHDANQYQLPQLDINFGLGNRIQLTYEAPYVVQTMPGHTQQTGWSNSFLGAKWRFYENDKSGWQISTFPQLQIAGPVGSSKNGIAEPASRFFLPIEITKSFPKIDLNFEAGYFLRGIRGRIPKGSWVSPPGISSRRSSKSSARFTTIAPWARCRTTPRSMPAAVTGSERDSFCCLWQDAVSARIPAGSRIFWVTWECRFC